METVIKILVAAGLFPAEGGSFNPLQRVEVAHGDLVLRNFGCVDVVGHQIVLVSELARKVQVQFCMSHPKCFFKGKQCSRELPT